MGKIKGNEHSRKPTRPIFIAASDLHSALMGFHPPYPGLKVPECIRIRLDHLLIGIIAGWNIDIAIFNEKIMAIPING
jgi:hypothetical protein